MKNWNPRKWLTLVYTPSKMMKTVCTGGITLKNPLASAFTIRLTVQYLHIKTDPDLPRAKFLRTDLRRAQPRPRLPPVVTPTRLPPSPITCKMTSVKRYIDAVLRIQINCIPVWYGSGFWNSPDLDPNLSLSKHLLLILMLKKFLKELVTTGKLPKSDNKSA